MSSKSPHASELPANLDLSASNKVEQLKRYEHTLRCLNSMLACPFFPPDVDIKWPN